MSLSKLFYLTPIIIASFIFSICEDGTQVCLSLDGSSLNYESTADIAGFQFSHDGCASGASGGDAAAAGFMVTASGSAVIGFSLQGSVIPAGSGTLVDLGSSDCSELTLTEFIFSDAAGQPLSSGFSFEEVLGCTDMNACNYDSSANTDDGSCLYDDCFGECGGSAVEDECGVCDGNGSTCEYGCEEGVEVCLSLDGGNLNYTTTVDVAGFQFSHNGCVVGAAGGDSEANGFMISFSSSAVIGFSLAGTVVPAGSGTLIVLDGDVTLDCLSNFIVSDSAGVALEVGFPVVLVDGCTDMSACNYDPNANNDDGSCEYPAENYDCNGDCVVDEDCTGECGGDAQVDECGVCEGNGSQCTASLSLSVDPTSGHMLVNMSNAMEVAGFQFIVSNVDISGTAGGTSEVNGFMVSANNGTVVGFSLSGATIPPGDATLVELDFMALWDEACLSDVVLSDSAGGAINWTVGDCVALDYTVVDGCMDEMACNYNPEANSDDGSCEYPEENYDCDGNCIVDIDCNGECGGNAIIDNCGECGGDDSSCWGCMDENALNYDPDATINCGDDCCQYPADVTIGVSYVDVGGIDVWMENIVDVAGFQFNVTTTCDSLVIIGGSGGSSDDNGFMVSTSSEGIVLGFSLTGTVIPAGGDLLTALEVSFVCEEGSFGLDGVILADISGNPLTYNITEDYNYSAACDDMDACNYGEPGDCEYPDDCYDCDGNSTCHYMVDIDPTGESHLIIFLDSISTLEAGDQIGIFDSNGVVESCIPDEGCDTDSTSYGEVLVGSGVWDGVPNEEGAVVDITAIMSLDLSDFNGPILNGAVNGNPIVIKVYDVSENLEYETEFSTNMGGEFGDIMTVVSDIDLGESSDGGGEDCESGIYDCAGVCDGDAELDECGVCEGDGSTCVIGGGCDFNGDGVNDDGFVIDCSLMCVADAFLGDGFCDETVPNFNCEEFNFDEGACEELSNDSLSPTSFGLSQNYPNPFNPETKISFSVPSIAEISLIIYDINGRVVDVLAQGVYNPGFHSLIWDGMSMTGQVVPSGVYLYKLVTPNEVFSKHLTILR